MAYPVESNRAYGRWTLNQTGSGQTATWSKSEKRFGVNGESIENKQILTDEIISLLTAGKDRRLWGSGKRIELPRVAPGTRVWSTASPNFLGDDMDDEKSLRAIVNDSLALAPREWTRFEIGLSLLKQGVEMGMRKRLVQDLEPHIVERQARRDRFIAAALSGFCARTDYAITAHTERRAAARIQADEVMRALDAERAAGMQSEEELK